MSGVSHSEIHSAASSLSKRCKTSPLTLAQVRGLSSELARLRRQFRSESARFDGNVLSLLREVKDTLEKEHLRLLPEVTKQSYGYDSFRPGQQELITSVLARRDAIGIMPTGAGKSLTYQIPSLMLGGTTLVVSPLIALMKDQVDALRENGVSAAFINSTLTAEQRALRVQELASGKLDLIYAAPEGIEASVGRALEAAEVSLMAVDEAHCISQWGHDFRPAYRRLFGLKRRFPDAVMLALTATATDAVVSDIAEQLGMRSYRLFRGSFFRRNLRLSAYEKGKRLGHSAREAVAKLVAQRAGLSGIIYCLSRRSTESTTRFLRERGIRASAYHAGMSSGERDTVQNAFKNDETEVVVATIAFGMGIDKPNIRYVIHQDMPRSVEGYYQEVGRAGRDGLPSDCVLFYSWADVLAYERFVGGPDDDGSQAARNARQMYELARDSVSCRHQALVRYFGEALSECSDACDVCAGLDVLTAARALERSSRRVKRQAVGALSLQSPMLAKLKQLRKQLASERGVPAYVIFSDAALVQMLDLNPRTENDLLKVNGVGPQKLQRYGRQFFELLRQEPEQ